MTRSQRQRIADLGSIKGDYPPDWKEIAKRVKDAAGWKCVRCGHPHDVAAGYTLTVHHLDMNPANCAAWNLAALCQRCHLRIQGKVDFTQSYMFPHSEWMEPFVSGYLESVLSSSDKPDLYT